MTRRRWCGLVLPALVLTAGCERDLPSGAASNAAPGAPSLVIVDAAHSSQQRGFYFLPPLVPAAAYAGTFDPAITPTAKICELVPVTPPAPSVCGATVRQFGSGIKGADSITVDLAGESYNALWNTKKDTTVLQTGPGKYRLEVLMGTVRLGYADLWFVASSKELKTVDPDYVGAVVGSTLPIKFRIEQGLYRITIAAPPGGGVDLLAPGEGVKQYVKVTLVDFANRRVGGAPVVWSVTPTGVAALSPGSGTTSTNGVDSTGLIGVAEGSATVTATIWGVSASAQLRVMDLDVIVGSSTVPVPHTDGCGNAQGTKCESLTGDAIADALRLQYQTDFAFMNSGGIRADLTCPMPDKPGDFCPQFSSPYPISRGQLMAAIPFQNRAVTLSLNGAELKAMLENGVARAHIPSQTNNPFPQVSGLCFTYDISAAAGSRVTGAVRQATDGSCTGAAIDLTAGASYTLVENDFMAGGGDGYPNFTARAVLQGILDQVVADWLAVNSPISPALQGRITCTSSGATPCPAVLP